ncbi:hypothetical protein HZB78_02210 [Candidatus Collierbacteria bacterium]|nr:hypothetical protein [Candidatus Collierbacteria bacterium]
MTPALTVESGRNSPIKRDPPTPAEYVNLVTTLTEGSVFLLTLMTNQPGSIVLLSLGGTIAGLILGQKMINVRNDRMRQAESNITSGNDFRA